jgi:hypothetical protein
VLKCKFYQQTGRYSEYPGEKNIYYLILMAGMIQQFDISTRKKEGRNLFPDRYRDNLIGLTVICPFNIERKYVSTIYNIYDIFRIYF